MINTYRFFCFLFSLPLLSVAQQKQARTEYGKIVTTDSVDLGVSHNNISYSGRKYLFNVFHLKIVTSNKDTLSVGVVYNIGRDIDSLYGFYEKKDKPYGFILSEFNPCDSDFPMMANCKGSKYWPFSGSFLFGRPYKKLLRVVDFFKIDDEQWHALSD